MTKPGFYKFAEETLFYAERTVYAPNFTLKAEERETYSYPIEGWRWFDTTEDAEAFFELNSASNADARWQEFAAALVMHPVVGPMVESFLDTLATNRKSLQGMIYVGIGQAAQGDGQTFGTAWGLATAAGFVSPELATAMGELASFYDLPAEFIAGLNPEVTP